MGGADLQAGLIRSDEYFNEYDRNEESDNISLKFLDIIKSIGFLHEK